MRFPNKAHYSPIAKSIRTIKSAFHLLVVPFPFGIATGRSRRQSNYTPSETTGDVGTIKLPATLSVDEFPRPEDLAVPTWSGTPVGVFESTESAISSLGDVLENIL